MADSGLWSVAVRLCAQVRQRWREREQPRIALRACLLEAVGRMAFVAEHAFVLPGAAGTLDQDQITGHRIGAHIAVAAQCLGHCTGFGVERFAAHPLRGVYCPDHVTVANTSDPAPATFVEQLEPGATKAGIGDHDGLASSG